MSLNIVDCIFLLYWTIFNARCILLFSHSHWKLFRNVENGWKFKVFYCFLYQPVINIYYKTINQTTIKKQAIVGEIVWESNFILIHRSNKVFCYSSLNFRLWTFIHSKLFKCMLVLGYFYIFWNEVNFCIKWNHV